MFRPFLLVLCILCIPLVLSGQTPPVSPPSGTEEEVEESSEPSFHGKFHEKMDRLDDFFSEDLEDLLSTELVTINSRQAQTVAEVPNIVTIITQDEIRWSGARTLGEALNLVPGVHTKHASPVTVEGTVHAETFLMRGVFTGETKHILFLLNGQRLNDAQSGGINRTLPAIPLYSVKRIEVIRGPGSARYGTSAFTGVVNIITKDGNDLRGGETITSGHSHEGFSHSITLGNKNKNWTYSIQGSFSDDDGQQHELVKADGNTSRVRDGREAKDVAVNLRYKNTFFNFYHYEHETDPFVLGGRANPEENERLFSRGTTTLANFGYEWSLPSGSLLAELQYGRFISEFSGVQFERRDLRTSLPDLPENDFNSVAQSFPEAIFGGVVADDVRISANLQWLHRFSSNHVLEIGFTGITETLVENSLTSDSEQRVVMGNNVLAQSDSLQKVTVARDKQRHIRGIYVQDNYQVNSEFSVYLGARYDDYSDFGNTFNPRAGLVYRATEQQVVKLLYGSAFRAPAFQERFTLSRDQNQVVENRLKPEKTQVVELAYLYGISKVYKFKANAYRSWVFDMIFNEDEDNEDDEDEEIELLESLENVIDLRTAGLELEFRVEFRPQHYLSLNYSVVEMEMDFREQEVKDLENFLIPNPMFNLIYNRPYREWLNLNLSISFRGNTKTTPFQSEDVASYTVANLHAVIRPPLFDRVDGFVGVRNLSDAKYVSPILGRNNLPERGREIVGGLRVGF